MMFGSLAAKAIEGSSSASNSMRAEVVLVLKSWSRRVPSCEGIVRWSVKHNSLEYWDPKAYMHDILAHLCA